MRKNDLTKMCENQILIFLHVSEQLIIESLFSPTQRPEYIELLTYICSLKWGSFSCLPRLASNLVCTSIAFKYGSTFFDNGFLTTFFSRQEKVY